MWAPATRKNYGRKGLRYQSEEWRVIEPHLPTAKNTGRPCAWPLREIVNGIFYVMRSGCAWRQLPKDLPPWSTVYRWFAAWRDACVFEKINHALVMADREQVGRPSAVIIDSQSVKTTEAGGPRGYDTGKKVKRRKRHFLVDTDGRGLLLRPHPASIQDRDGGGPLLQASRRLFPFIERVFDRSQPETCQGLRGQHRLCDSARAFLYAATLMPLSRRLAGAASVSKLMPGDGEIGDRQFGKGIMT